MKRLEDMPATVRKKVRLEPADAGERTSCWIWTGTHQRPRQRYKAYAVPDDHDRHRNFAGCRVNDRGTPMMHSPEMGYAIAAHRVVYSHATERPVSSLPRLSRCKNDLCVSPHHVQELEPVSPKAKGRRRGGAPAPEVATGPALVKRDAWKVLTEVQPYHEISPADACEECELPPGSISAAMWARYQKWALEQDA